MLKCLSSYLRKLFFYCTAWLALALFDYIIVWYSRISSFWLQTRLQMVFEFSNFSQKNVYRTISYMKVKDKLFSKKFKIVFLIVKYSLPLKAFNNFICNKPHMFLEFFEEKNSITKSLSYNFHPWKLYNKHFFIQNFFIIFYMTRKL